MAEPSDTFYIIGEGTVSVEASFVDIPLAQRAVTFPVNVALPNNGWCAFLHALWASKGHGLKSRLLIRSALRSQWACFALQRCGHQPLAALMSLAQEVSF